MTILYYETPENDRPQLPANAQPIDRSDMLVRAYSGGARDLKNWQALSEGPTHHFGDEQTGIDIDVHPDGTGTVHNRATGIESKLEHPGQLAYYLGTTAAGGQELLGLVQYQPDEPVPLARPFMG